MKHVFGTIGLPGSGKSTFADIAKEVSDDIETTSMGDIVRKLADKRGLETSGEIGEFASEMRDKHGQGIFAEKLIEELDFGEDTILIVDGIRSPAEIQKLRETTDCKCTIVYIKADRETRYSRVVNRGREGEDEMDMEDFIERDEREISWGFNEIVEEEYYDEVIENEGTYDEFVSCIKTIVRKEVN